MKILSAFIVTIISSGFLFCQIPDVKPLHPGNKWFYSQTGYAHGGIYLDGEYVEIVTSDSLVINDSVFHYIRGFFYPADGGNVRDFEQRYEMSDSTGVIYRRLTGESDRVWDFSYPVGYTIIGETGTTVILAYYDTLFFNEFSDMVLVHTTTDHFNFSYNNHIKAIVGLGLVYLDVNGIDHSLTRNLHGALLDGIAYGDTSYDITTIGYTEEIPNKFMLSQNYPNPFNPNTQIRFSIPETELVSLIVFDVLGNEVATLVNEERPAGTYEIMWNAADLSSGVYLYQIKAGEFI